MSLLETTARFFEHYRRHDVDAMLSLFGPQGVIDYVPADLSGPASGAGREIWSGLIDAFPDLSNEVSALYPSADGRTVTAEVVISGTQAKDAFGIENKGGRYSLPHVFILHGNERDRIMKMTAYWDNAKWYSQLGKMRLD